MLASSFFNPALSLTADSMELFECIDKLELLWEAIGGENGEFGEFCRDLFWDELDVFTGSDAWVSTTDSKHIKYVITT